MNIIHKLTLRQLRLNKKRTLVTIIGTIISAAMITAVATLGLSFMDVMQRQSIAQNGEWHAKYRDVSKEQLEAIKSNHEIKTVILSSNPGYAYLEGSQNQNKPYLCIKNLSTVGFHKLPIKLSEGRLPKSPNEIILSNEVITDAKVNLKLGDQIELNIGQRYSTAKDDPTEVEEPLLQNFSLIYENDKVAESLSQDRKLSYTIVGFMDRPSWEYNWSPGYTAVSYIDENTLTEGSTCDVSVIFKKVNLKLFNIADRIASDQGIAQYEYNNDLLRYYGIFKDDSVKQMLYSLTAIIMVIIVIGSVSLIYNAFAISVSERSRYLGMLSSVGATKRQKRNSVFFEGAVIGGISIPLGIAFGYIGLGITFVCINPLLKEALNLSQGFRLVVYPSSLITAVLVSVATILVSVYIPARRASRISAIDAIRQVSDVKIKGRQVHTFQITRLLFGIEGDLGLKNLKRNKGRYKATVFSLIISMVLFLVVTSFTEYIRKSFEMTQEGINFDIQTSVDGKSKEESQKIVERITSLNNIDEMTMYQDFDTSAFIDKNKAADFLREDKGVTLTEGKYAYQVKVHVMDDNALKKYTKEIGADYEQLTEANQPSAIVIDIMKFKDNDTDKYVETKLVKMSPGEQLELSYADSEAGEMIKLQSLKVAALTKQLPMGIMSLGKTAGFHIIISQTAYDSLVKGQEEQAFAGLRTQVYFNSDKPLKLQTDLEAVQSQVGASNLSMFNVYNYKDTEEHALILVSVFTYAFIILITAICIANIINTISTSIALRKREFAMLKSIGITPKGFNRMLNYESIFYGMKALLYGLPISILVMYLMHHVLMAEFDYAFVLPMGSICVVIASVFLIVGTAMIYSSRRVRRENIIDALKQDII
jgi:putative ABC transport system permease protein